MHDPLTVAWEIRSPIPRRWPHSGRRHFPLLLTVWHREPGGADSGTVCKPHRRVFDEADRTWKLRAVHGWRFHAHHFKLQLHPAQDLRRRLLTRCSWCGGRSRGSDPVNLSHQWDGPRGRWWRGEPGLYHHDCSSVEHAHKLCYCPDPLLSHDGYGTCATCGGFRSWRQQPDDADRMLAALPAGSRIPAGIKPALDAAWAERRKRKESAA